MLTYKKVKMNLYTNIKYMVKVWEVEQVDKVYYLLVILRFLLTLIPQKGYIHPDEFFQSIEVMAGDIFDIESNKPWEFNQSFPIRSIFTPYMMVGIPYKILRSIDNKFQYYLNVSLKTPYWLVVLPRIQYCLLSFIVDYCLHKICVIHYEKYKGKLILLASSYVILVFGTHTFSNTMEMILMSILLYLVIDSHIYSYTIVKQDEYLKKKYDESSKAVDRACIYKIKATLPSHSLRHCIFISFIVTMGTFNRPTFLAFAFPCIFFWIYRGIGYKIVTLSEIHIRMLLFILNCFLFSCLFIIFDSAYFGYLSGAELLQMDISINNFVITPLNFIKYNLDVDKLADHGLHPRFLHLFVNIPLLYNILGVVGILSVATFCLKLISGHYCSLPSIYDVRCLMMGAVFIPIIVLSYFPHQEARFLIPISLPLIYLYGDVILNRMLLLRLWWLLNGICLLFFGFIHQAGLLPMASYLSAQLQTHQYQQIHLVTSHVYSLPVTLLVQRNSHHLYGAGSSKYLLPKTFILHELGSESPKIIMHNLKIIHHMNSMQKSRNSQIYLALPLSKEDEFKKYIQLFSIPTNIDRLETFYPHISTEALPDIFCNLHNFSQFSFSSFINSVENIIKSCGLGLYKVYNNDTVTLLNKNAFI